MNTHTASPAARVAVSDVSAAPGHTTLVAADGRHLAATWTEPDTPARAVAVIHSAVGVPRGFYRAFAQWLAARGYAVLSYDYRGIGGSRSSARLRDEPATLRDWAVLDMSAALAAAEARRGGRGLPLLLVGHSFGGNSAGFAQGVERADAVLTVASQLGETRHYPGLHRWVTRFFFRVWLPGLVPLFGHLPAWALGPAAQPLPAGCALQWARWSRVPGWAYGDPAMQAHRGASAVVAPVHLWNISDDLQYAPPRAVDALAAQFRNAAVQRHTLTPADIGARRIGHFGAFRRELGARAWEVMLERIEQATPSLRRALG